VNCWIGVHHDGSRRIVRLAGKLCLGLEAELLMVCNPSLEATELDLSGLVLADAAGITALRRLQSLGVSLVGVPEYIQLKLDDARPRT
jgi:hypothetical protein